MAFAMNESEVIICRNVNCQQKLRVPINRGLVSVSCPVCKEKFDYNPPDSAEKDRKGFPDKKLCKICSRISSDETITLTNGDVVHLNCENDQILKQQEAEKKLSDLLSLKYTLTSEINKIQNEIDRFSKTSLLSNLYESFLGMQTAKEIDRRKQLSQAQSQLPKAMRELTEYENTAEAIKDAAEKEIKNVQEILRPIYDYWPGYPPDWEERRKELEDAVGGRCQRCRFNKNRPRRTDEKRYFHVHHKTPISKGGSHKIDNLKYLCIKCHQLVHPYDIGKDLQKMGIQKLQTKFTEKVALINEAIETKATLKFKYEKRDGQIMMRTVNPEEIKLDNIKHKIRVVGGYCHLRKATRHFTILRMNQIRIIK